MTGTDARTYCGYLLQTQDISLDSETSTIDYAIADAVEQYSQDKPLVYCKAMAGDGTKVYSLSDLTNFDWDFSVITGIEYPIDKNPPSFIGDRYWGILLRPSGDNNDLILAADAPQSGETFHVYYTYYTAAIADVRAKDARAVVSLACSYLCEIMANKANQGADDTVNADFIDRTDNITNWSEKRRFFEKKYQKRIFGDPEAIKPAVNITNMDTYIHRKHARIIHKREDT